MLIAPADAWLGSPAVVKLTDPPGDAGDVRRASNLAVRAAVRLLRRRCRAACATLSGAYEALDEAGALVGNFYFEQKGDALEVGLGLRPDLTGRGLGLEFLLAGIDFGRRRFGVSRVILNVAAFNERAITVYERAGFRETGRHTRRFDRWGEVEFVDMEQAAERG